MARQRLTQEEQQALESFRQLYGTNPQAITSDMGSQLWRNLPAKVRDKLKPYLSQEEKAAYNKWIRDYKKLPANQQTNPQQANLGQSYGQATDLTVNGAPERMNGILEALLRPMFDAQSEELRNYYQTQDMMNRPNIYGPTGQTTYQYNPETGRFEQVTVASESQQKLLDTETGVDQEAAAAAGDFIKKVRGAAGLDYSADRQSMTDQVYQQWQKVNEPQFAKQLQDFEQGMANRGIPPGSDQYNKEKDLLLKSQQDQRDTALVGARQQGRDEQLHAINVSQNQPAALAASLLGMGKGPQLPTAPTPGNVDVTYLNRIDTAMKGIDQVMQSDQFNADIGLKAKDLARRFGLDEYKVKEELKLNYKQLATQQAIAEINKAAQLGAAGIAANATITAAGIDADARRDTATINNYGQNADSGYEAPSPGESAADGFAGGVGAGMTRSTRGYNTQQPTAPKLTLPNGQQSILPANNTGAIYNKGATGKLSNLGFGAGSSVFGPKRRVFG